MSARQNGFEYRVVWQRQGYAKRRKTFGRLDTAERYVLRLTNQLDPFEGRDDDEYACCSGYECGCYGQTVESAREEEQRRVSRIPPVIYGPVVQKRPVGDWETVSESQPAPFPLKPEADPVAIAAGHPTYDDVPF